MIAQASNSSDAAAAGVSIVILLISAAIGIAALVFHIIVLVDILKHSDAAWAASGQSKGLWIGLWVLGFCCGGSLIIDLIYWFAIRPKLVATGGFGSPPGY